MNNNQASGTFKIHVAPKYESNKNDLVIGLILLLDGFIIQDARMKYTAYTMLLELVEDDKSPLVNSLDKKLTVGDTITLYVEPDNYEYSIYFMITAEMIEFCEEWKEKNFRITFWNNTPDYPTFSVN